MAQGEVVAAGFGGFIGVKFQRHLLVLLPDRISAALLIQAQHLVAVGDDVVIGSQP